MFGTLSNIKMMILHSGVNFLLLYYKLQQFLTEFSGIKIKLYSYRKYLHYGKNNELIKPYGA
jgi:hypothetical protein